MKYQILVKENIVMIGNEAIEKDCSMFVDEFVFCEINDDTRWVECDPFVGREDLDDWDEVLEFIKNAENSLTEELILREEVLSQNTLEEEEIILTEEEIAEELAKQEEYRVQSIKLTAQSLILSKYPLEKQSSANLGIYGEAYLQEMKDYISNIIRISNEAEVNGTKVEDIQWQ